jgi:signal transduction histidine kinase
VHERNQVAVTVSDNGPGIADADKPMATKRFYRGGGQGKREGIGLGLSVVEAIARLHGGTLALIDNHPGLVATLVLPRGAAGQSIP